MFDAAWNKRMRVLPVPGCALVSSKTVSLMPAPPRPPWATALVKRSTTSVVAIVARSGGPLGARTATTVLPAKTSP